MISNSGLPYPPRHTWSLYPDRLLTICTKRTLFDIPIDGKLAGAGVGPCLLMVSVKNPSRTLLGDRTEGLRVREKELSRHDFQPWLGFDTIPSYRSGKECTIKWKVTVQELCRHNSAAAPHLGEEYNLTLQPPARFRLEWWNRGDLKAIWTASY